MAKETITVLMVAPNMKPCVIELYNDATFLRAAVSLGLTETADELNVFPLDVQTGILCCKYAALWGGKLNRKVGKWMFAGVFFVVGVQGGTLTSLSPAALEIYKARFQHPLQPDAEDDTDALLAAIDALQDDCEVL